MAEIEFVVQPYRVADDIWRKSVVFVISLPPTLAATLNSLGNTSIFHKKCCLTQIGSL